MHILADENISQAQQYFAPYGRLSLCPGRHITRELLSDVDVLLVRSVTRVDAALLEGTACRFVGTATSGIDHIDIGYLNAQGIAFAAARGCNAEGVVDYVFSACAALALERGRNWLNASFGIIGCGEIGSRLARRLLALGLRPRIHDPLLPQDHPLSAGFDALAAVLQQDIVTLHVPLTQTLPAPTWHMIDAAALQQMPADATLINAARGEVIDEQALFDHCDRNPDFTAVLDAWRGEPAIDARLLDAATYGTAHIAGYSYAGKLRGTQMVHAQFCQQLGLDPARAGAAPPLPATLLELPPAVDLQQTLSQLILAAYDLRQDDVQLRACMAGEEPAAGFDRLRRNYGLRREFSEFCVTGIGADPALRKAVAGLGLQAR